MPYTSPVNEGRLVLLPRVRGVMPGRMRSTSAALVPTTGIAWISSPVSVAVLSPELSGVSATSALTDTISATVASSSGIVRTVRLSPACSSMPVISWSWKPGIVTVSVYAAGGNGGEREEAGRVRHRPAGARCEASLDEGHVGPGTTPPRRRPRCRSARS